MSNLRWIAANVVDEVASGRSLDACLQHALQTINDHRDKAFVQALCYGVCRHYTSLDAVLVQLLQKPLKAKDHLLHALLLVGLYQLMHMRVKEHAAVSETVSASGKLKASWARGLVNAVLREYLRRKEDIEAEIRDDEEAQYAHSHWWIDKIKQDWPTQWQEILIANNEHPPLTLRVNQQKISRDAYLKKCAEQGIDAVSVSMTTSGIQLATPLPVEQLPGFDQGEISVQDGAAQLVVSLLDLAPNQLVLDACAAPGGKLTHLLEAQADIAVVAIEKDKARIASIHENLTRLQLNATVKCDDVVNVERWWDGKLVDRILLDAPCSASGVIRRHPDIKLLRKETDIAALAKEQRRLLNALWSVLKPGGMLVYATCSIFNEENNAIIHAFLTDHLDAEEMKLNVDWGVALSHGRQILPGMHAMDGFYYAKLRKLAEGK